MATASHSSSSYIPPASYAEYMQRLAENSQISGRYLDTAMHMPCPFCAAPDFLVYKIIETQQLLAKGAVCKECGRGAKVIFSQHVTPGPGLYENPGCSFEFVQTCGPDQPEWLEAKMRRVDG